MQFKAIINSDNGFSFTYRTIIAQTTEIKRLTKGGFLKKN
jgi:hypothetical protein